METEVDDVDDVGHRKRAFGDVSREDDFTVVLFIIGQSIKDPRLLFAGNS